MQTKEHRLWEMRPQEVLVPFQYDGMIPSDPGVAFSNAIKNPVVVSIVDAGGNIREGEVAIPPHPLSRLCATVPSTL